MCINVFFIQLCLNPTFFMLPLGGRSCFCRDLRQAEQVVSLDLRWWRGLSLADWWFTAYHYEFMVMARQPSCPLTYPPEIKALLRAPSPLVSLNRAWPS